MDRAAVLLQRLRTQLGGWADRIQRGVGATYIEFAPAEGGEFTLRVKWKTPEGEKTHERLFSREYVFGHTFSGSPLAYRVQKPACDYARDFMREVLTHRGAIR